MSQPIRDVDLVVTIGGDGTLRQASHVMDNLIPVEEHNEDFDATRSTGYLCAATIENFEQILDDIHENRTIPSEVARMTVHVNSEQLSTYALNDVLIAHPCPATVSRFSFRIWREGEQCSSLVNSKSSGLRVSTATGPTAAVLSAGGFAMPILSRDLQYMVKSRYLQEPTPVCTEL
ncbi:hypothetical protein ACH5RR_037519 [Cinchona calisaya]|uniref:Uncharacterized protein n=1 Tax=Cinchona calisaya TaxID=153742 RepID=A0ABD2YA56_9GENT